MNLIRTVLGSPDVDEGVRRWPNRLRNVVFWKAATSHRENPSLMGENQARLRASAAAGDPRFGEGFCLCQERMQKLKGSSWSSHLFRQVGEMNQNSKFPAGYPMPTSRRLVYRSLQLKAHRIL